MSNHYQNSQSVREMTKATLFDSSSVSQQNETTSFVADCADSPCCPFLKLINKPFRELRNQEDEREGRRGVGDIVFHFQEKNCCKHTNDPIPTGLAGLCSNRYSKMTKDQYQTCVMFQPDLFFFLLSLTFLSTRHKIKHLTLFLESKLRVVLRLTM